MPLHRKSCGLMETQEHAKVLGVQMPTPSILQMPQKGIFSQAHARYREGGPGQEEWRRGSLSNLGILNNAICILIRTSWTGARVSQW